ncbi:hypothetical protein ACFWMS_29350, partial [Peribacillus butanolivorans]|uniref:hypothetical protein n=1 Tax=Peribacillus butanolivorans TaxID=421767 RepID=UPI0036572844
EWAYVLSPDPNKFVKPFVQNQHGLEVGHPLCDSCGNSQHREGHQEGGHAEVCGQTSVDYTDDYATVQFSDNCNHGYQLDEIVSAVTTLESPAIDPTDRSI